MLHSLAVPPQREPMTTTTNETLWSRSVLLGGRLQPARVTLSGEQVHSIEPGAAPATGDVDLGELVLMPGIVDTHVHVNEPGRTEWEGWDTATAAAALGGVTTLADMPLNSDPVTTTLDALGQKVASTTGKLRIDCALWGGVVPGNTGELAPMVRGGVRGFKCFLCPSGIDEFPEVNPTDLRTAMPALRALGVPLLVHAEIEAPLREASRLAVAQGDPRDYQVYLHSRPPEWENAAVAQMIELCEETGCAVHIVHLSSAGAIDMLRRARARGLPVTAETCPHYLCLRAEDVPLGDTAWKCAPPIRGADNREALWAALDEGVIDFVVTDHSPCIPGLKLPEEGDFLRAWGGIASLQLGLASVATEARARGHSIARISQWMSAGPARLLGLSAGQIVPGARADLVAWDPDAAFTVDGAALAHRHPLTPYQGRDLRGRVQRVWLRGHTIVDNGALVGDPTGQILSPLQVPDE
jgi:allantoinase